MSSFTINAIHKKTKQLREIFCIDDYFGKHRYGYSLNNGSDVMTEKAFYDQYEVKEIQP